MSDLTPTAKVGQAPITGAVAIFLIWLLSQFGVVLPTEVAAAIVIILVFLVGYFIMDRRTPSTADATAEELNAPRATVNNDHIMPSHFNSIEELEDYAKYLRTQTFDNDNGGPKHAA